MARAFFRLGLCLGLGLWSLPAAAQGAGDVMEDESEPAEGQDTAADKDDSGDDAGDGDWSGGSGSSDSGFHFGLRLGFGFPLGKATGSSSASGGTGGSSSSSSTSGDMSDTVLGQIPIWVDLGWQFSPSFMLGGYFSYGFGLPSSDFSDGCDEAKADCRISDIRVGLQAQYSFSPGRSTDPWIGAGVGYEWFTVEVNDALGRLHGWELFMLQGGIDFGGDSGGSTIGPFVAVTYGQFTRAKIEFGGINDSTDVTETAAHQWLFVGLRGVVK